MSKLIVCSALLASYFVPCSQDLSIKALDASNDAKAVRAAESALAEVRAARDEVTEQLRVAVKDQQQLSDQNDELVSEVDRVRKVFIPI